MNVWSRHVSAFGYFVARGFALIDLLMALQGQFSSERLLRVLSLTTVCGLWPADTWAHNHHETLTRLMIIALRI
eukprot:598141-Amphidinium_carterae.1